MPEENIFSVTLSQKIERLIVKYRDLEARNDELETELEELKKLNSQKDETISKLRAELDTKSGETDELLAKIEAVLGI